jgi:hypothetical protein
MKGAKRRSKAARKRERERRQFGDKAKWIRDQPCVSCGRQGRADGWPMHAAHVRSRGAGGTSKDLVPLCGGPKGCHAEQHWRGILTFQRERSVDLGAEARRLEAEWQRHKETTEGGVRDG